VIAFMQPLPNRGGGCAPCRRYVDPALSSARFRLPDSQAGRSLGVCLLQPGHGRVHRVAPCTLLRPVMFAQVERDHMEARIQTKGGGYIRPPDPANRRGALAGAPRNFHIRQRRLKSSRSLPVEARPPGT